MGPMRETKMQTSGSKDALKEMLARPGSGEPDDAPMPLEQIHKELGRHVNQDGSIDQDSPALAHMREGSATSEDYENYNKEKATGWSKKAQ